MSFAGLIVIWIMSIFATGLMARRNGRSTVGWIFFALFAGPIAFLAVLLAGRPMEKRAAGMLEDVSAMACPRCGKLVATGSAACPYCGQLMNAAQEGSVPDNASAQASDEIDDDAFQRWFKAGPFADSELSPDAILALRDVYARELRSSSALDAPSPPTG